MSTPMVQAILQGRKKQTRRIIKPAPKFDKRSGFVYLNGYKDVVDMHNWLENILPFCPYGKKGDLLWVRETFFYDEEQYIFKADLDDSDIKWYKGCWKPSIFMPKKHTRIWLEIIDVRVERLKDITEHAAHEEGINEAPGWGLCQSGFKRLWQAINGKNSWKKNPYVWVLEFKPIKK